MALVLKNDKKKEMIGPPVRRMRKDPFFVYSGHSTEGYTIDWSHVTPGRLATADRDGNIHVWGQRRQCQGDQLEWAGRELAGKWGGRR